jgi:hypothetical protein
LLLRTKPSQCEIRASFALSSALPLPVGAPNRGGKRSGSKKPKCRSQQHCCTELSCFFGRAAARLHRESPVCRKKVVECLKAVATRQVPHFTFSQTFHTGGEQRRYGGREPLKPQRVVHDVHRGQRAQFVVNGRSGAEHQAEVLAFSAVRKKTSSMCASRGRRVHIQGFHSSEDHLAGVLADLNAATAITSEALGFA